MTAAALSPARALHPPRRVDWRALFGIFLLLFGTGGAMFVWTASSDTRPLLVATRDLPAGATLTGSDLAVARVRVDESMYQAAIPASAQETLVGKQLSEPMHAQQLLVQRQF